MMTVVGVGCVCCGSVSGGAWAGLYTEGGKAPCCACMCIRGAAEKRWPGRQVLGGMKGRGLGNVDGSQYAGGLPCAAYMCVMRVGAKEIGRMEAWA
jgi:hypothetical protein